MRTCFCFLTWNRLSILKNTINSFIKYNPKIKNENMIIVDNGSTDGTQDFLKKTNYDIILNKSNFGAQMGKYISWNRAVERGFDFIVFIEDDHLCCREISINDLEKYLDKNQDVGIIRLNDKKYLKRHQITHLPITYFPKEKLNNKFNIFKCTYHFTSHPSIFRTNLVDKLKGCVFPELKPKFEEINISKLGFDKYKNNNKYKTARERVLTDFGIKEKEYMRLYMWYYNLTAQIKPACFQYIYSKRSKDWSN